MQLLRHDTWDDLEKLVPTEELDKLKGTTNKATQLINAQGDRLKYAYEKGIIEDF